jgi:hypothetical protein
MTKKKTTGKGTKGKKKQLKVRTFTLKNPTKESIAKLNAPKAVKEAILKGVEEIKRDIARQQDPAQPPNVSFQAELCQNGCCVNATISRTDKAPITAADVVNSLQSVARGMRQRYQPGTLLKATHEHVQVKDGVQMPLPFPGSSAIQ